MSSVEAPGVDSEVLDEDEELATEIFGTTLDEYLMNGIESYFEEIVEDAWNTESEGMISFDQITSRLNDVDAIDAGFVQDLEVNTNLHPTSSGWHYVKDSRVYEVHFADREFQVEFYAEHNPQGVKDAGFNIFEDTEEAPYDLNKEEPARSELPILETPSGYGR